MICPRCQASLQITQRDGIEIDYCTTCHGVWLDKGELHKLIELEKARDPNHRLNQVSPPQTPPYGQPGRVQTDPIHRDRYEDDDDWEYDHRGNRRRRRRRDDDDDDSFLGRIFDIFD